MSKAKFCFDRLTRCDTGQRLNPLMHIFMFVLLVFSTGMLIGDPAVASTVLYTETAQVGTTAVNLWGAVGLASLIVHAVGLLLRGRYGVYFMSASFLGGFYVWAWAAVIYLSGGFYFQFLASALPNLVFWIWYTIQWRIRYNNRDNACVAAFVN